MNTVFYIRNYKLEGFKYVNAFFVSVCYIITSTLCVQGNVVSVTILYCVAIYVVFRAVNFLNIAS